MNEKKIEFDALHEKTIHTIWTEDLDAFMTELKHVWAKEEVDRQKMGGVVNEGKGKKGLKRKPPAKKATATGAASENAQTTGTAKPRQKKGGDKSKNAPVKAAATTQPKDPSDMTLLERMQARLGKDMPMQSSLFSGKMGLTASQHEAFKRGPGVKRAANETTIFNELNAMANQVSSDISDDQVMLDDTKKRKR